MLTKKQIEEIREHLSNSQNPLFLFDNDSDGLCSFLLLQRYIGRGKGVPIKSRPALSVEYFRKVEELNADCIFILDKPIVSQEFFEEVHKINIPIVWIDHHPLEQEVPEFVSHYNPLYNKKKNNEPTTYLAYQVSQKKDDLWLAVTGCTADKTYFNFFEDFKKKYPELSLESKDIFEWSARSQVGKIMDMFSFGLKDRTTNVIIMLKYLMKAKGPYDVLEETKGNKIMHGRYNEINEKFLKIVKKGVGIEKESEEVLAYKFAGNLGMAADVADELKYLFPKKKMIIVGHDKGEKINLSIRGEKIRDVVLEVLKEMEDSNGGGHPNAVGARIKENDWKRFLEKVEKLLTHG